MTVDHDQLQRYFDDELSTQEAAEVQKHLEGSPESTAELRQLGQIRAAMQEASAEWTAEVDSNALFARIEQDIDAAPAAPPLKVIRGGGVKRVYQGLGFGLAAAAAILIAVLTWPDRQGPTSPTPPPVVVTRGSEVLEVDFGNNTGTVFEVEGAVGQPLAVVWIDDEVGLP